MWKLPNIATSVVVCGCAAFACGSPRFVESHASIDSGAGGAGLSEAGSGARGAGGRPITGTGATSSVAGSAGGHVDSGVDRTDASSGNDGSPNGAEAGVDAAAVDAGSNCTAADNTCTDPTTLNSCNARGTGFDSVSCPAGCVAGPPAHCAKLTPTAPVTSADLTNASVTSVVVSGNTTFNSDTGEIKGAVTRTANLVTNNLEVISGIGFRTASDGTGIFVFNQLVINGSATTVKVVGTAPVAFVAGTNLQLSDGVIDVRPMDASGTLCAAGSFGPGGSAGGKGGMNGPTPTSGSPGKGPGPGGGGQLVIQGAPSGGGGGGHFKTGGKGGAGCHQGSAAEAGGNGGVAYSARASSGGGGGGYGTGSGIGGGGGGSLTLVAGGVLTIGDGTNLVGVNAGGCGGKGAPVGAGGGGSGGSIVLEAPVVQLRAKATLAANGGGGGGTTDGQEGQLSNVRSLGYGSSQVSQLAGDGGAGDSPAGTTAFFSCGSGTEGLGGGGSAGTIRILAAKATPNVNAQSVLSPSLASGGTAYAAATVN